MGTRVIASEPAGQELRSTDRPIYGAAVACLNNTLYLFGGYYSEPPWNMETLYRLPATVNPSELEQLPTDPYASPTLLHGQMIAFHGMLYVFGGHHPTPDTFNTTVKERLRYYRLDMETLVWTPLQKDTTQPLERYWHSVAVHDHFVYLFGGMNVTGPVLDVFWKYDLLHNSWTAMPAMQFPSRCGHTASMTGDGKMVVLGGYDCIGNYTTNPLLAKHLADLRHALVFDTIYAQWTNQSLQGSTIPCSRAYHTAVTSQDGIAQPFQTYLSAAGDPSAMTAMLDTKRWLWVVPDASLFQPFPRSFAVAAILNDTRMVYGFGINYHTIYDGIYVFDIPTGAWLPPNELASNTADKHHNIAVIIGTTVLGIIVVFAALAGLWIVVKRCRMRLYSLYTKIRSDLWRPRAGEPLWAELSRLFFRALFMAVFLTVVVVLVLQVQHSPIIDQKSYMENSDLTVDVPDIRFCFDDWTDQSSSATDNESSAQGPVIQCSTDFGDPCSQFVIDITNNTKTGLSYYGSKLTCYLFRAPTNFRLGQPNGRQAMNGSYLKFYYYGSRDQSNTLRMHTVFYNKLHDPNLPVYEIKDPYGLDFEWYDPDENAAFQSTEQENLRTSNAFDFYPTVVSSASYQLVERQEMRDNVWNFVGIAAMRDRKFELTSKAVSEATWTYYATEPQPIGSLHVFPTTYKTIVMQEQRAFTLVNAMGIMGGISGLIIGLQACLFGYRPRSPWGVIHRWSVGHMRLSLLHGLRSRFPGNVKVPIVHPVHRRFSTAPTEAHRLSSPIQHPTSPQCQSPETLELSMVLEKTKEEEEGTEEERMARLEERLHVLEMLFQSYYINDEIFRSLDHALHLEVAPALDRRPTLTTLASLRRRRRR